MVDYESAPASSDDRLVAVVVPTYNEAENLPELTRRLSDLKIPNMRLILIDDNSPDGTAEVAKSLEAGFNGTIDVISRESKQGLGTAYIAGFTHALAQGADIIVQMDADLSHLPEYIPGFLEELNNADVVVGSRYTEGGGVDETWSLKRRMLSYLANLGIRAVVGLKVRDATSGFKGFRSEALRRVNLSDFRCTGFAFQAEMAHACQSTGCRIVEHPIIFVDRTQGTSKMSTYIIVEALWRLLPHRWKRYPHSQGS
ncbi:MAG: polyprenol monophosphomannose synthase [Chloroflexi bacterium]|nr:polyprenol monophosphomannose synthase [Chloroflexota bacterium]